MKLFLITLFSLCLSINVIAQNREEFSLDGQWSYCADPDNKGIRLEWFQKGLPVRGIRYVNVPHTFNTMDGYYYYWGAAWYEKRISISKNQLKKTIRLQFDAVNHDAIIYINGHKAAEHIGSPYTRFTVNISPFVREGENIITVYVSNAPSKNSIPYMKSFDWPHDGGIIRSVRLIMTDPAGIRNVHVNATPNGNKGIVNFKINLLDADKTAQSKLKILATITEENQPTQKVVFKGKLKVRQIDDYLVAQTELKNIHLWHFDHPNLYKADFRVYDGKVEKDEYSVVFGFRTIRIENNRYVLNGEPMRLMGMEWTSGEDMEHGLAQTDENIEKGFRLMKEANCVFARCHWQQDEHFLDLCDRNGILVMEEVPLWGPEPHLNDTLLGVAKLHLDEMIDDHYNHPSIIIWGLGNELSSHEEININGLDKMEDHVQWLDKTRLVAYISNAVHWEVPGHQNILPDASPRYDMIMYNEYNTTWYGDNLDSIPVCLDRIHKMYPEKPITISEWGICEPRFKGGDERRAKEMAEQIKIYGSKDYVAGAIYFCLNDYRTHFGEDSTYSYPQRIHGICDVKLNKKPSYDVMKEISSPLEVKSIESNEGSVQLVLLCRQGVPSYAVRGYYIIAGSVKVVVPDLLPGQETRLNIATAADELIIYRPTGYEVLRVGR